MHSQRFAIIGLLVCGILAVPATSFAQQEPPATGDEAALLSVLQSAAPIYDKAKACQQLAVIGTKDAVPVLARLLADEQLSHYARFALEPLPDPSVDEALRASLTQLQGGLLVGVINSIGMRRDAQAVDALKTLLAGADPEVAAAAACALGRIASPPAIELLQASLSAAEPLRWAVADGCLTAADTLEKEQQAQSATAVYDAMRAAQLPKYLELAALAGAIRSRGPQGVDLLVETLQSPDLDRFDVALSMANLIPGNRVTETLVAEISKPLPAPEGETGELVVAHWRAVGVVTVLGKRGDPAALPVVLKLAQQAPPDVQLAAVRALARLGDASAVPALLDAAASPQSALAAAALDSLAALPDQGADARVLALLDGSSGPQRLAIIEVLGRRGVAAAAPALMKLASSDDKTTRAAAFAALGLTVGQDHLAALVEYLVRAPSDDVATAAKAALERACQRMPDRDAAARVLIAQMRGDSPAMRANLLDLLRALGGPEALAHVVAAAKADDQQSQDAATQVLGQWTSPDAAPALLELTKAPNNRFKVRTLRGYIRIARQLNVPTEQRIEMCRTALGLAERDEDLNLILETLGRYPSAESLALVTAHLGKPALAAAAANAAVAIGEKLVDQQPADVAHAMQQILAGSPSDELKQKATRLLQRATEK